MVTNLTTRVERTHVCGALTILCVTELVLYHLNRVPASPTETGLQDLHCYHTFLTSHQLLCLLLLSSWTAAQWQKE